MSSLESNKPIKPISAANPIDATGHTIQVVPHAIVHKLQPIYIAVTKGQ